MTAKIYFSFGVLLCAVVVVNAQSAFDQQLYKDVLDSEQCSKQLNFLATDPLRFQLIDSSAKLPSGVLLGHMVDMGDYFQCLSINELADQLSIQGKYCIIQVPLDQNLKQIRRLPYFSKYQDLLDMAKLPMPSMDNETEFEDQIKSYAHDLTKLGHPIAAKGFPALAAAIGVMVLAVCIPKACTVEDTIDFVLQSQPNVNLSYMPVFCRLSNDKPFVAADYTAIGIFSFIGLLVLLSTSYDIYQKFFIKFGSSRVNPLYTSFSIYTNTKRFLTFKSSTESLDCVDGIRAISMLWVIMGHTYCVTLMGYLRNLKSAAEWLPKFTSVWITSAPIVVDTFFLLSGILVVYAVIGKISRGTFVRSLHLFYLHRLLRIFPLLAATVLLQASLFNHVSDGPFWQNVGHSTENCRNHWWSALLHVQNYENPFSFCLEHSWYLSVDTQLFIVCPVVLIFLFGRKITALAVLAFSLFLAVLSSSLFSFLNNFPAGVANPRYLSKFNNYVKYYYANTPPRSPPFVIGMICGYMLYLWKDTKIRISTINVILLWLVSFAMMSFCIFTIHPLMQFDHKTGLYDNFLNAYMRTIWGLGVGWLIFACAQGYGGPINWFLSLKLWKLPARLSFAMYLLHLPIIMIVNGTLINSVYFTDSKIIYQFFSNVSITFISSFILSIIIDAPFSTLQKLLTSGITKKHNKPATPLPTTTEDNNYLKTTL